MGKIAVVLFNLGGPDQLSSVKPFLFNLFNDPAIIQAPQPMRWLIAKLISTRRDKEAQEIYQQLGGKSPLLDNSLVQAKALENQLSGKKDHHYRVFIAMRYWHPMTPETVGQVKEWGADQVILLPLYPQLSTTTTLSSYDAWKREAKRQHLDVPTQFICSYPDNEGFIGAQVDLMERAWKNTNWPQPPRILFSAHGLPQKIVDKGDPYPDQIQTTAAALMQQFPHAYRDWKVTFQSRVGPVAWIKPYTDEEISQAAQEKIPLMIVPLSFVSEHSETLVELDIQYKALALESIYVRVPTVGDHPLFVRGLETIIANELSCGHNRI